MRKLRRQEKKALNGLYKELTDMVLCMVAGAGGALDLAYTQLFHRLGGVQVAETEMYSTFGFRYRDVESTITYRRDTNVLLVSELCSVFNGDTIVSCNYRWSTSIAN